MKRFVTMLLIAAVILSLSACKRADDTFEDLALQPETGNSEPANTGGEEQTGTEADETGTLPTADAAPGVSQGGGTDEDAGHQDTKPGSGVGICTDYAYVPFDKLYEKADLIMICRYDGYTKQVEPDDTSPAQYANYVYTDQYVTPIKIVKGSAAVSIAVRRIGGVKDDIQYSSDDPKLQNGESYLLFLYEGTAFFSNDVKCYKTIGGSRGCYHIKSDGTLVTNSALAEDIELLIQFYNSIK